MRRVRRRGRHRLVGADAAGGEDSARHASPPVLANATRLPFRTGVFDVGLCGFALHIIPDAEHAFAEIHRVLRPGGTLAFSVPGPARDNRRWDFYPALIEAFTPHADKARLFIGPPRPLEDLVAEAGFGDIEHGHAEIHLPLDGVDGFWAWHQSRGARALVDALPAHKREEFRAQVYRHVQAMAATGPVTLDRGAVLTRARRI